MRTEPGVTQQPNASAEGPAPEAPTFPFLTGLWRKGTAIAIVIGVLSIVGCVGYAMVIASKLGGTASGAFMIVMAIFGIIIGAIYGILIKMYSETAGVWLSIEDSARYLADVAAVQQEAANASVPGKDDTSAPN